MTTSSLALGVGLTLVVVLQHAALGCTSSDVGINGGAIDASGIGPDASMPSESISSVATQQVDSLGTDRMRDAADSSDAGDDEEEAAGSTPDAATEPPLEGSEDAPGAGAGETSNDIVFLDTEFDLKNYDISVFPLNDETVNITQTLSAGNPGAALQIETDVPPNKVRASTMEYFLNESFVYDIAVHGAILSIDFSSEVYFETSPSMMLNGTASIAIIEQHGNIYEYRKPVPSTQRAFHEGAAVGLRAQDFDLIPDPAGLARNRNQHPDFSSGVLRFGTASRFLDGPAGTLLTVRRDNLSFTIHRNAP